MQQQLVWDTQISYQELFFLEHRHAVFASPKSSIKVVKKDIHCLLQMHSRENFHLKASPRIVIVIAQRKIINTNVLYLHIFTCTTVICI